MRWSLDGLDRLTTKPFTTPASSTDAIIALQDFVSPVAAFVRDSCDVGPHEVAVQTSFTSLRNWCEENGHKPGSAQTFGRDLGVVAPAGAHDPPRDGDTRERRYQVPAEVPPPRTPQW